MSALEYGDQRKLEIYRFPFEEPPLCLYLWQIKSLCNKEGEEIKKVRNDVINFHSWIERRLLLLALICCSAEHSILSTPKTTASADNVLSQQLLFLHRLLHLLLQQRLQFAISGELYCNDIDFSQELPFLTSQNLKMAFIFQCVTLCIKPWLAFVQTFANRIRYAVDIGKTSYKHSKATETPTPIYIKGQLMLHWVGNTASQNTDAHKYTE